MRILITGARGQLGCDTVAVLGGRHEVTGVDLPEADITDAAGVAGLMDAVRPDWVVNCAAFTRVDDCETEREAAWRANAEGPRVLAEAVQARGAHLVHLSTDYVFDGLKPPPAAYVEEDPTGPLSYYGETKLAGERAVLAATDRAAIVRTAWLYGVHGRNFLATMRRLAADPARRPLRVVNDQYGSPTWSYRLALQLERLIDAGFTGLCHASGEGACTWFELAAYFLERAGVAHELAPCITEEYPTRARRPRNSILAHAALERAGLNVMTAWQDDVDRYILESGQTNGA